MLLELFVTFVYGLSGYSALCTNQSNGCTYMRKQRQRHFGGKNALLTHRGHPCLSLSKLCLHIPQELKRAEQLWYTIWYGLLLFALYYMLHFSRKKEPIFTFILSRKNGWKKICLSIQNHGFKSIFIALLEMALSCWYFGALKGQMVTGVSKITRIRILAGLIFAPQ